MSEAIADALNDSVASTDSGVVEPTLTERIRQRPLLALGVAGLAGFIFGGGAASRTGVAMLTLVARISLRRAASDALAGAITGYGSTKRNGFG